MRQVVSLEHARIIQQINAVRTPDTKFVVILRDAGGDLTYVPIGPDQHPRDVIEAKTSEHVSHVATINFFGVSVDEQVAAIPPYRGDAATVDTDCELVTA